ncbi:MAG: glutathione S-transferase family protein [Vulcanococcus sp.]
MDTTPLNWTELQALAVAAPDSVHGPASAQARLRLFGQPEEAVRVTLIRDHHAWCPYCQKVWLWLEERQVPYRIRKVSMFCYGDKEEWFLRLVPSGMLPVLELDGRLITESDRILMALEHNFGALGLSLEHRAVLPLRQLERRLFSAWCQWLCRPGAGPRGEAAARGAFERVAADLEQALGVTPGPFLLDDFSSADLVFVPFLERMNASLADYKGLLLRHQYAAIDRWFTALEQRDAYLGTQSDFHTHVHDLPPQLGGCCASGDPQQQRLARRIDAGPWPISDAGLPDPESSRSPQEHDAAIALGRVLRHRHTLIARNPLGSAFELPLRCALTHLSAGRSCPPPPGSAAALRYLRDRICVPRDMSVHAARLLRRSLKHTAGLDPGDPDGQAAPLPLQHRRDQDPAPFLAARL